MRLLFLFMLVLQACLTIFAVDVYEGQSISLVFQESLEESSLYTILFNDVTIYEDGSPVEESLPAEWLNRMDIQETPSSGLFSVQVNIQQTDRADAGTYTLRSNPATDSFVEENIDLLVIYPPSDPQCDVTNNTMTCHATEGYPKGGLIKCYHGNDKLTNTLQVAGNGEIIEAKYEFSAKDTSIGCCTESSSFFLSPRTCTQFVWSAAPTIQTTKTIIPTKNKTIPEETTRKSTTTETPLETDMYLDDWLFYHRATLGFVGGILFVLLILYPFGMIYHFKVHMREPKKYVSDSKGRGHFTKV